MGSEPSSYGSHYWWNRILSYDRDLFLKWNPEKNRYELWRWGRPQIVPVRMSIDGILQDSTLCYLMKKPVYVVTLQDERGEYMPVDRRLFEHLMASDGRKWKSPTHWSREVGECENKTREKQMKNFKEEMEWIGQDTRRYIAKDL